MVSQNLPPSNSQLFPNFDMHIPSPPSYYCILFRREKNKKKRSNKNAE